MENEGIKRWIAYWNNANMVAFEHVNAFDQVHLAREYCPCMADGVFGNVTDLQIWNALTEMRENGEIK